MNQPLVRILTRTMRQTKPPPSPPKGMLELLLIGSMGLFLIGCAELDAEDLVKPVVQEAGFQIDPARPFDSAEVTLVLRLEAGANVDQDVVRLAYVKLFDGSTWRTNEPAVQLRLAAPEGSDEPFDAGEVREVSLQGPVLNEQLTPYCGESLRLLITIRTTGAHSLLGATEDVLMDCGD